MDKEICTCGLIVVKASVSGAAAFYCFLQCDGPPLLLLMKRAQLLFLTTYLMILIVELLITWHSSSHVIVFKKMNVQLNDSFKAFVQLLQNITFSFTVYFNVQNPDLISWASHRPHFTLNTCLE